MASAQDMKCGIDPNNRWQQHLDRMADGAADGVNTLDFYQAMTDFKTMFPSMDEEVIEAVLRANKGVVDATIDQLLAMNIDYEAENQRNEKPKQEELISLNSPAEKPSLQIDKGSLLLMREDTLPSLSRLLPQGATSNQSASDTVPKSPRDSPGYDYMPAATSPRNPSPIANQCPWPNPSSLPLRILKNWNPPLLGKLPEDFLRITLTREQSSLYYGQSRGCNSVKHQRAGAGLSSEMIQKKIEENERQRMLGMNDDPELMQYLEDERIALFLQNEEFMQELRRNHDFMSTLEKDTRQRPSSNPLCHLQSEELGSNFDHDHTYPETIDEPPPEVGAFPYTKTLPHSEDSDAAFRDKLKNMGKMSQRKFAQLARLFFRRKKRTPKQILSDASAPSMDNLLEDEEEPQIDEKYEDSDVRPYYDVSPENSSDVNRTVQRRSHTDSFEVI